MRRLSGGESQLNTLVFAAIGSLLLGAAGCFAVGRAAPARGLGLAATAAALVATVLLALARPAAEAATGPAVVLLALGEVAFSVSGALGAGEWATALALVGGGAAAMLALAGAIAPGVRGFGAIFAWALVALAAALFSLATPPLSLAQPLTWAVLTVAGYASLRASGSVASERPPLGLTFGLLASVLLAGGLLATGPMAADNAPVAWPAALCGLLAALGLAGCPPLAGARADAVAAPAPLGALIYGLAAPAAALGWLLRAVAAQPVVPTSWAVTLCLVGGLGALACGAGALGVRSLRASLTWMTAGQGAVVVAAAGLAGPLAALAGPGLLVAMMLSSTLGSGAAATLERTTGSDDYTAGGAPPPMLAGAVWALAGAAALGLPPLWSFWPRLWLFESAYEQQPWLLTPLLFGAVLTTLAVVAPLARLWGGTATLRAGWPDLVPALVVGLPLLVLGLAPWLAWGFWLQALPFAPGELPAGTAAQLAAGGTGLILIALCAWSMAARPVRAARRDPDEDEVRLAPDALGDTLRPLAWLGNPEPALAWLWAGLQRLSELLRLGMGLFEQRYYLLGVLAALVTIMLLMAQ